MNRVKTFPWLYLYHDKDDCDEEILLTGWDGYTIIGYWWCRSLPLRKVIFKGDDCNRWMERGRKEILGNGIDPKVS